MGDRPELSERVMNQGDGGSCGGSDGPASTQKVDLLVGVDPAFQMESQMEVQQGDRWTGTREGALFCQSLLPGRVRAEAGGAANGGVLALNLPVEHDLCGGIAADFFIGRMATRRFCRVPKRRSILPLACGLGATRWVTPRAEKAR